MPCIRRRYHYGSIYIDDTHPELAGRSLMGTKLDILLRSGDFYSMDFHGFIRDPAFLLSPVKLLNVEAYADNGYFAGQWLDFSPNAITLGDIRKGKLYIPIYQGIPIVWCDYVKKKDMPH